MNTTIFQSDSEEEPDPVTTAPDKDKDNHQNNNNNNSTPGLGGGRGILKKVSNAELPNLELIHSLGHGASEQAAQSSSSPSRMVKFDMPSFDSHTSAESETCQADMGTMFDYRWYYIMLGKGFKNLFSA